MTTLCLQDIQNDLRADIGAARSNTTTALGLAEPPGDERPALALMLRIFGREGRASIGAFLFMGKSK